MSNIAGFIAGATINVNAGAGGGGGVTPAGVLPGGLTVDDVFSAYTYTGNRNSQNINNGVNLVNQLAITYGQYLPDQSAYVTSFFDTSGNRYQAILAVDGGFVQGVGGALNLIVYKYSSTGAFLYTLKRDVGSFISTTFTAGVNPLIGTVDSSGNVFLVFNSASAATVFYFNDNNDYVSFINVQQRTTSQLASVNVNTTVSTFFSFTSISASNGALYLGGTVNSGSVYLPVALRVAYTSSAGVITLGALVWVREINSSGQSKTTSSFSSVQAIMVNPTNNTVYMVVGFANEMVLTQLNALTGATIATLRYAIPATLTNSSMLAKLNLSPNGVMVLTIPGSTLATTSVRTYTIASDAMTLVNAWQFNLANSNLVTSHLFTTVASDNSVYVFATIGTTTPTIVRIVPSTGVTWVVTFTNNNSIAFQVTEFIVSGLTLTVFLTAANNNLFIEIPTDGNIGNPITVGTSYTVTVTGTGGASAVAAPASTGSGALLDLDQSNASATGLAYITVNSPIFITVRADIGTALGRINRVNQPAVTSNGGMIWTKIRDTPVAGGSQNHAIYDTVRGLNAAGNLLETNANAVALSGSGTSGITGIYNGYQLNTDTAQSHINYELLRYISWTFRRATSFFDVVNYTGTGTNRSISHALGSVPGFMIIKANGGIAWSIYHRSAGANVDFGVPVTGNLGFQSDNAANTNSPTAFNSTNPSATAFTVGTSANTNQSGVVYIAYLFAHDPSPTGIIQCGVVTLSASNIDVNLGWEPQFVMLKPDTAGQIWTTYDSTRGVFSNGADPRIYAGSSNNESASSVGDTIDFTPTGFTLKPTTSGSVYYVAIRRSSAVPTNGAQVFQPVVRTGTNAALQLSLPFRPDLLLGIRNSSGINNGYIIDSVRGNLFYTPTQGASSETALATGSIEFTSGGVTFSNNATVNSAISRLEYYFRRARNFLDIIEYVGNGIVGRAVNHGLAATPQLILLRTRSSASATYGQFTAALSSISGFTTATANNAQLNSTSAVSTTTLTLTNVSISNTTNERYIAYLFGNVPGVCNIGTYTGDGTTVGIAINCGFSNGARFILIKALNTTGQLWVFDTARGITTLTDSGLNLTGDNTSTIQTATTEQVTPYASGFRVTGNTPGFNLNTAGIIYGYMAIS